MLGSSGGAGVYTFSDLVHRLVTLEDGHDQLDWLQYQLIVRSMILL